MIALKVHDNDNVATIFALGVSGGTNVYIKDKKGGAEAVVAAGVIPYGHKIAAAPITKGAKIVKYGEVIGAATLDIKKGEHVHVHNMESLRGRGDLGGE
jgi:altronate dehydratase small subunit